MNAPTTMSDTTPGTGPSSGLLLASDQPAADTQKARVAGEPLSPATHTPVPTGRSPGSPSAPDHTRVDIQTSSVGGTLLASDQPACVAPTSPVAGDPLSPATIIATPTAAPPGSPSAPDYHRPDAHEVPVGGTFTQPPSIRAPLIHGRNDGGWDELRVWAEILDDAQQSRKANFNRVGETADGRSYRANVDPEVYRPFLMALEATEKEAWRGLIVTYRRVVPPELIAWQKQAKGVGDKRLSRILGHLGDPCVAIPHRWEGTSKDRVLIQGEPYLRTVAQLWAYCGVGDPTRKRRSGMTADDAFRLGSPFLKSQVWNMASEVIKVGAGGEYRPVYDQRRAVTADRVHLDACPPCHAKPGDPWKPGHQHTDALRILGKRLLKDMWLVRRASLPVDQPSVVTHTRGVGGEMTE